MNLYSIKIRINICEKEYYIIAKDENEAKNKIINKFDDCIILKMKLISNLVII